MPEQESADRTTRRVHERASDPADTAERPLEPRSSQEELRATDELPAREDAQDAHHRLNTPIGDVDPTADSDPYRTATPEDDADTASGVRGEGEGAEDR